MFELFLGLVVGLAALAVLYAVMMWIAGVEKRASQRQSMVRVYYPKRGRKAGLQKLIRRQRRPLRR